MPSVSDVFQASGEGTIEDAVLRPERQGPQSRVATEDSYADSHSSIMTRFDRGIKLPKLGVEEAASVFLIHFRLARRTLLSFPAFIQFSS